MPPSLPVSPPDRASPHGACDPVISPRSSPMRGRCTPTRGAAGAPVPAEVGFGVVDASIYAIQRDNARDLEGYFYSGQEVRVQTDFSFAAQYSGGAFQTIAASAPGAAGATSPQIRVRRQ